jgi:hypothetical protein
MRRLLPVAALCGAVAGAGGLAQAQEQATLSSMEVCAGSPVPGGWIVTGGRWDPMRCGNPTSVRDNVLTITQHSTLPAGASLQVCTGQVTPDGWVVVGGRWDPTSCGRPSTIHDNVVAIRRVQ